MKILGIDPGLNNTGWGVIKTTGNHLTYIASGVIKTSTVNKTFERINFIFAEIQKIIKKYQPNHFVIEETFVNKNPMSSLKLGSARAAAILAATNLEIPVFEYSAKYVKKSVVGSGSSEKHQVLFMLKTLIPTASPKSSDESDALAVAISHSNYRVRIDERKNFI